MNFSTFNTRFFSYLSKLSVFFVLIICTSLAQTAMAYEANDQDSTPLSPAVIQPLVAKDGFAVELMAMSPNFRNYLSDIGGGRPNYYTTKTNTGSDGKVWVAYEIFGVTLDDSQSGGVKLGVKFTDTNQATVPSETLLFSVYEMVQNPVILEQAIGIQKFINHPNNSWLSANLRKEFGDDIYSKFLERLVAKGAHKRAVIVREYEVFPDEPVGFLVDFMKGEEFMPLAIRVSVGTNNEDLGHLFTKSKTGQYTYEVIPDLPWYRRYKTILILAFVLATLVGARAWLTKR